MLDSNSMEQADSNRTFWKPDDTFTRFLCVAVPFVLCFFFLSVPSTMVDEWFMLNVGHQIQDWWTQGHFPTYPTSLCNSTHTDWSIVIEQPWTCLIKSWIYDIGGLRLLSVANWACATTCVGIIVMWGKHMRNARCGLLMAIFCMAISELLGLACRPLIISMALAALTIWLASTDNKKKILILSPLISLFWIRIHAALWVVGLGVLLIYSISDVTVSDWNWKSAWQDRSFMLIAVFLYAACGPSTSYGVGLPAFIFKAYTAASVMYIPEMLPPDLLFPSSLMAVFAVYVLIHRTHKGDIPVREFILGLIGAVGIALAARNHPIGAVCLCPALVGYTFHGGQHIEDLFTPSDKGLQRLGIVGIALGLTLAFLLSVLRPIPADSPTHPQTAGDTLIADAASRGITRPRVTAGCTAAAYMQWRGCITDFDGRPELYMKSLNGKEDYLVSYKEAIEDGTASVYDLMKSQSCQYVLLTYAEEKPAIYQVKHDDRFTVIYDDQDIAVVARLNS